MAECQNRVIVVGSGLAGLTAACELLECGCRVILIEKEANLGGNSSKATTGIAAPGSALQAAAGVADDGSDLVALAESPEGATLIKNGPRDVEWLTKTLGVNSELVLRLAPGHKTARIIGTKTHFPGAVITYAAIHVLQQLASVKPDVLEIMQETRVTKLIHDSGRVTGVEYEKKGGVEHEKWGGSTGTLNGQVLLATGGYSGDFSPGSILETSSPSSLAYPTTNDERASGDGIKLGRPVGADSANLQSVQLTPTAAILPGQENCQFKIVVSDAISGAGAKMIDGSGKRFCNEMNSSQDRVREMSLAKGPFRLVIAENQAQSVEWLTNFYAQRKIMKTYKSAAELARDMGVRTVDATIPANKKLYVATITPALYTCAGGLKSSWSSGSEGTVLNTGGKPISGLFAAGEATSSPIGQLWSVSGIPLLYAIFSGRLAGRAAAAAAGTGGVVVQDLRDLVISSITTPEKIAQRATGEAEKPKSVEKSLENMSKEELIAKVKNMQENGFVSSGNEPSGISMDEVKKHNTKEDAWMVINGDVIDVTAWIPIHPGGEQAIVAYLGQDASDEWNMIHKPGTVGKNLVEPGGKGPVLLGKLGGGGGGSKGNQTSGDGGLTMADVAKHTVESDVWVVVNGKAYDVTKWTQVHPGGVQAIMAYAGKDATDEWNCIHKPGTIEKNLAPANPNGPVDMGPVSGAAAAAVAPVAVADDEVPAPPGNGGIPGALGAIIYLAKSIIVLVMRTVFFTGNFKFNVDNNRKGTIRSACFLLTFTIIHVMGNFVGMIRGPLEANGEGYFFDRLAWTGGFGIWKEGPVGMSAVELYLALALLLHVSVALKRSWDISLNYCVGTGRWNMLLSGLTVLFFLSMHLADIRFSSKMKYSELRPPPNYVAWPGILEGRVFYEVDESIPKVRVRDLYTREVELFKDLGTSLLYTVCICVFWAHMLIGWKKLVPADAMQIPKDHVTKVTYLGWFAATAIVSMYLSVIWYTYLAPVQDVVRVG